MIKTGKGRCGAAMAVALAAMAGFAKADPIIYDTFVEVNIYYGVVQLYSPANVLLSTTVAMTVETQFPYSLVQSKGQGPILTFLMPLMDQSVATQLANDPIAGDQPIPAYIANNLPSFENADGFGAEVDSDYVQPDPNSSPSPSAQQLYQMLTNQPGPFAVTSDTGFVELGSEFDYAYAIGPFGPVPGSTADTIDGITNVEMFERDLQLQQTAVPEPASIALLGLTIGLIRMFHRRSRRMS